MLESLYNRYHSIHTRTVHVSCRVRRPAKDRISESNDCVMSPWQGIKSTCRGVQGGNFTSDAEEQATVCDIRWPETWYHFSYNHFTLIEIREFLFCAINWFCCNSGQLRSKKESELVFAFLKALKIFNWSHWVKLSTKLQKCYRWTLTPLWACWWWYVRCLSLY